MSPNGSPGGIGSKAFAWVTYVFRPSRIASTVPMMAPNALPMSSCQYGIVQPPYLNPPSVSSSAPPGAWITPSRDRNSETISFRMFASVYGSVAGLLGHLGAQLLV